MGVFYPWNNLVNLAHQNKVSNELDICTESQEVISQGYLNHVYTYVHTKYKLLLKNMIEWLHFLNFYGPTCRKWKLYKTFVFSDKATFHASGVVIWYNYWIWGPENQHQFVAHVCDSQKMNVWCNLFHKKITVLFFFFHLLGCCDGDHLPGYAQKLNFSPAGRGSSCSFPTR